MKTRGSGQPEVSSPEQGEKVTDQIWPINQAMRGEIETERGGERINSQESELMAETAVVRSYGKGSPSAGEV